MLQEDEVRKKVKTLKRFYTDVINFALINILLTLIWLTFDRTGVFWPKYVILIWGIVLVLKAFKMGVLPIIFHRTSFLGSDWEEKKVRELMRRRSPHSKAPLDKNEKEQ